MTMLAAALEYVAKGQPVFPCDFNKRPILRGGGFKDATTNVDQVTKWWQQHPRALIGLPTGESSKFFAIDLDTTSHGGPDGLVAWDALTRGNDTPPTRRHSTASGGVHLLYQYDPNRPVTNRRGSLPAGIDVRGDGGYIIAPPSETPDGRRWTIPDNCETDEIAEAPDWLYHILAQSIEPPRAPGANSHSNYARAALESELAAVAGAPSGGRNETLNKSSFSLGQLVGPGLLSEAEVADRLFGAACACGIVKDDGAASVKATIASGLKAGMAKPREIPEREAKSSPQIGAAAPSSEPVSRLIWFGDQPPTPPSYLVADTLPEIGVAILGGQFGFAKTFVGADLVSAVITGGAFAGKAVNRRGGVLWLAAEGESEIEGRVRAAVEANGADPEARQPFARQAGGVPSLAAKEALAQLEQLVAEAADRLKADFDTEIALIVIDTLSAAAAFEDENSAAETQRVMTALATLARKASCLVLAVDHHGKAVETGIRGSSAKSAAADAILACLGDRDPATGDVANRRLAIAKLRSGPTGRVIAFDLVATEDGATCTVKWKPEAEAKPSGPKAKPWPKALVIFKRALDEAIDSSGKVTTPRVGMPEVKAVDREAARAEFFRLYPGDTSKAKRAAFLRSEKDAIERGVMCALNVGPELSQTVFWLRNDDTQT